MQKTIHKGAILVWALFLSFFIAFAFISFALGVNKTIKRTSNLKNEAINAISFNKNAMSISSGFIDIDGGYQLVKDTSNTIGLLQGKSFEARCLNLTLSPSFTISISKGGPIEYKFLSLNSGSGNGTITSVGLITNSLSFIGTLQGGDNTGILYIRNLGGYTGFNYTSSVECQNDIMKFQVTDEISKKYYIKSDFQDTNFTKGDFPGLDYEKYEMNF